MYMVLVAMLLKVHLNLLATWHQYTGIVSDNNLVLLGEDLLICSFV